VPFAKRHSLVRTCFRLHIFCQTHSAAVAAVGAPFGYDRVEAEVSFARSDDVSACQRGRRRDCERSDLRVRMTNHVEEQGLLRPGVAPMF